MKATNDFRDEQTLDLLEEISRMPVLDAHEHLVPEHERVDAELDIFSLLLKSYIGGDFRCAGMDEDTLLKIRSPGTNLGAKWKMLEPFWERAKHTTYGRVVRIALNDIYQEEDFSEHGAERANERMEESNTAGVYGRILTKRANIVRALTQRTDFLESGEEDLFSLVYRPPGLGSVSRTTVETLTEETGVPILSLDDFLKHQNGLLRDHASRGTVGVKAGPFQTDSNTSSHYNYCRAFLDTDSFPVRSGRVSIEYAEEAFDNMMEAPSGDLSRNDFLKLNAVVLNNIAATAAETGMVMAIHTGAVWDSWLDFRLYRPTYLVPLLMAHPDTRFDIYHAGIPWPREMAMIAKTFPNVWVNLTWSHIISPEMTVNFLDELMDMIPPNKIIGFGGDYVICPENVYGHLVIARENIARVLARRIDRGRLDRDEAARIARSWLWDNPAELYRLDEALD